MNRAVWVLLVGSAMATSVMGPARAQAPATPPPVRATLNQLMRGAFYPASNVFFAAQDLNPADVPRAKDPNMATDPLTSVFGKWEAVDNSALTLSELADLLMRPGQKCSNGRGCSGGECGLGQVRSRASGRGSDGLDGGSNQEPGQDYRCRRRDDNRMRELPQQISREETRGPMQVSQS